MPDSSGRTPYRSPEGSFEVILKSALEDYAISADEFRVVMYLAAKPAHRRDGGLWQASAKAIAYDLGWAQSRAERALRMLRRDTSYLREVTERKPDGRIKRRFSTLNRELVIVQRTR